MSLNNFKHIDLTNNLSLCAWVYPERNNMIIFENRVNWDNE